VAEIRGSRKLRVSPGESPKFGCSKLREAKSRSVKVAPKRHVAELHSGPENLTNGHTSPIGSSQHPVDLSHLGDSGDKGMEARAFNSRSRE
jgi:hypothetical protein